MIRIYSIWGLLMPDCGHVWRSKSCCLKLGSERGEGVNIPVDHTLINLNGANMTRFEKHSALHTTGYLHL